MSLLTENYSGVIAYRSLKNSIVYETADAYDMNNTKITHEVIRQAGVDYIKWILYNTKVPDYDIRLVYMSTPTKDSYKAKGLDKKIEEVNAKAKEQGIE